VTLDAAMTVTRRAGRRAGRQAPACSSQHKLVPIIVRWQFVPVSISSSSSSGRAAAAAANLESRLQQHARQQLQQHAKAAAVTRYKGCNSSMSSIQRQQHLQLQKHLQIFNLIFIIIFNLTLMQQHAKAVVACKDSNNSRVPGISPCNGRTTCKGSSSIQTQLQQHNSLCKGITTAACKGSSMQSSSRQT